MQWLYCHARRTYAHEVEQYNKDIDSLSLTLGLIGLSHPAVGLSVLPIEFGIEYTQWREADFQKRMDLALAVAGAGDYRLADRAIETLGSGEVTLYIGVAAMAAGGLGAILSPPVLGAAAFLIAEYLKMSYLDIVRMAIIPTCLYYFGLLAMTEIDLPSSRAERITPSAVP